MSQAQEVLAIAKKFVDEKYKEGTNNDTIFGKWYGLNNQPWCAMFVSYCFNQAGYGALVAASGKKGFASCEAGFKWFAKKSRVVPVGQAQPGDIVFFNFDSDPTTTEHVGIVYVPQHDKKQLVTFEGNTAADGSGSQSNGDGAYKKTRKYEKIMAVVRPEWTD